MSVKSVLGGVWKTMKIVFVVFCVYLGSLFFRAQQLPCRWIEDMVDCYLPANIIFHIDSASFGFRQGIRVRGLRVYDASREDPTQILVGAEVIDLHPLLKQVRIVGAKLPRLHDNYYKPGNSEKNARVECTFPNLGKFTVTMVRPEILAVEPETLVFDVEVMPHRIDFGRMRLDWPDCDCKMSINGFCYVDLDQQRVYGEIEGLAKQSHIRPMLVAIDVPVALPYMDGFTDVKKPVNARCTWDVNLVNNDLDLNLELHPILGKYNTVPMNKADGVIHLHNYTRGNCLNYRTTVGPIVAEDVKGRHLGGTVTITGTNNYNIVDVEAKTGMPLALVLKIGGFTGDYIGDDAFGNAVCDLQFRFPRAMTNNYEVLNGRGHISVADGHIARLKVFAGLTELLAEKVPGVSALVDQSQASGDYTIENGVIKSDNISIEGGFFSIGMSGQFDAVKNEMNFRVRVQLFKNDSLLSKLTTPITWTFSKLLLEFSLTGSPQSPKWGYVSVLDRVMEVVK